MTQFREHKPKDHSRDYTFEDYRIIKELLRSSQLTEEQKAALDHLSYSYEYAID